MAQLASGLKISQSVKGADVYPPSKPTSGSIRQQAKNDTLIGGLPIIPPWDRWCIAAVFEYLRDRSSNVRSA